MTKGLRVCCKGLRVAYLSVAWGVQEKVQEKETEKVMSLDDLFKKTEALPQLYWLPLTEKQIAAKAASIEAKSTKEKA